MSLNLVSYQNGTILCNGKTVQCDIHGKSPRVFLEWSSTQFVYVTPTESDGPDSNVSGFTLPLKT